VLGAGAPEVLVDGTADEFVEESVIHLQESSRKMWYGHLLGSSNRVHPNNSRRDR
jgi:hypothetical protein